MIYAAELFYLQDQRDFPFQKAVLVTVKTISQWCTHYQAELLASAKKYQGPIKKQGGLPSEPAERASFVEDLVQWVFVNSQIDELFNLLLDNRPVPQKDRVAKFDHHDDTYCWFLNLSKDEFANLQDAWHKIDLPENLFYPENETLCLAYPGNSLKAKLLRALGVQKHYTPMQLQAEFTQTQEKQANLRLLRTCMLRVHPVGRLALPARRSGP